MLSASLLLLSLSHVQKERRSPEQRLNSGFYHWQGWVGGDTLSQNHCPTRPAGCWVARARPSDMGVPSPLPPTGTPGVGLGLMHAGCQARAPAHVPAPAPSQLRCGQCPALQSSMPSRPLPAPAPVVRPPSLGKRLGSSEGVDLPVPTHPILIFLGKINTPNMSALRQTGPAIGHIRAGPSPPISKTLDPRKVSLCALR